jgi:hypothetical protein
MSDARHDSGAAEVSAGDPWVGVKVQSRDECAHGVTLSGDEGRWLHDAPSAQFGQFAEVDRLKHLGL